MITVHKFPITDPVGDFKTHAGAEWLCVKKQGDTPMVWARVDTRKPVVLYGYKVSGTGEVAPTKAQANYIGTWLHGPFVWHLFIAAQEGPIA